jgi:hypothetical protein
MPIGRSWRRSAASWSQGTDDRAGRIDPAEAARVAAEARRVLTGKCQSGISDWGGMNDGFGSIPDAHHPRQRFWHSAFSRSPSLASILVRSLTDCATCFLFAALIVNSIDAAGLHALARSSPCRGRARCGATDNAGSSVQSVGTAG